MPNTKPRKIVPPVYLLLTLVAMAAAHRYLPLAILWQGPGRLFGAVLIGAGIIIAAVAAGAFVRAKTPVVPFHPSTALVTSGLYRVTRNPMYLGMVLVLLGTAVWLGSAAAFLPIVVFIWIIQTRFIVPEEQFLTEIFGTQYVLYKAQVRRWL